MNRQRQRLTEAMTIVAARHGYAEASVARVVKQAGMSRATFYEHFEGRDDCFRAAFEAAVAPLRADLEAGEGLPWAPEEPRTALGRTLSLAAGHPEATKLVLIEGLAGDPGVRVELEDLLDLIERSIDQYLSVATPTLEIPARALLGGIGNLIGTRVYAHESGALKGLLDDVMAWSESYALPPGQSRLSAAEWEELGRSWIEVCDAPEPRPRPARALPRGRSALTPGQVAREHRERIVAAIAGCVRRQGYAETTVADVVAAAGVTRAVFYEQFRSKEDAFLAALVAALQESISQAAAKFFSAEAWVERIWDALKAMLAYMAANEDLVWIGMVESYAVGESAIGRSFENRMAYTLFLEDGYRQRPEAESLPHLCSEAIGGALLELIRKRALLGRCAELQELLPQAAYVALAPFIGAGQALEFVREKSRKPA